VHYKSAHQVSAFHVQMGPRKVRVKIGVFLSKTWKRETTEGAATTEKVEVSTREKK